MIRLLGCKIKGEWVNKYPPGKQEHFTDISWPRNEGRP